MTEENDSRKKSDDKISVDMNTNNSYVDLDKRCMYDFSKSDLVRIEYPGLVRDVDKAVETLGGMFAIQSAVADNKKLELKFHPKNRFNKGCIGDRSNSFGVLIKLLPKKEGKDPLEYEVVGATKINFNFNRLIDYQYLPLVAANGIESKNSSVNYFYNKILTQEIPSMTWFLSKENSSQPVFLTPPCFARFDVPQGRLATNSSEIFKNLLRTSEMDIQKQSSSKKVLKGKNDFKVPSIRVNFYKADLKIPDEPPRSALELIKDKSLQKHYSLIKALFAERPIWMKAGVIYKTQVSREQARLVLPAVAYYSLNGPWRSSWIRYGYNPLNNVNSRIYQTLDYRIRTNLGMKLRIKAKRTNTVSEYVFRNNVSNEDFDERSFMLKPNCIPPARQMLYQYCDILIPEVQDMLWKLPKLPDNAQCDPKIGWLPCSFTEHCREIANKYVIEVVQKELLNETKTHEPQAGTIKDSESNIAKSCSKMLHNIKKGAYQRVCFDNAGESSETVIDLVDDETEQIDADDVVGILPERIAENSDESDMEIDLDAVEEVNQMVGDMMDFDDAILYNFCEKNSDD